MTQETRFWKFYAIAATTALALLVLLGARQRQERVRFEEIDVERLNIIQPDGKVRLAISNRERFPAPVMDGTVFPTKEKRGPGMIFFNDDGDECGGLVFGNLSRDGAKYAGAGFFFDQYKQDQTIGMLYNEGKGERLASFNVWDRPDRPLTKMIEEQKAVENMPDGQAKEEAKKRMAEAASRGEFGARRVLVGKTPSRDAQVVLYDAAGRPRLKMVVDAKGDPRIDFLSADGKTMRTLTPSTSQ